MDTTILRRFTFNWRRVTVKTFLGLFLFLAIFSSVLSRDNTKNGVGGVKAGVDEKAQSKPASHQQNSHTVFPGISTKRNRDYKKSDGGYCNLKTNPPDTDCSELEADCIQCELTDKCGYGKNITVPCTVKSGVECRGSREFKREIVCQYCYQTPLWQQTCNGVKGCNSVGAPRNFFQANCTVDQKVICLGSRWFSRNMPCKWKNGYRWSTTLFLSITMGGFGADRFYLGRWQEGIGKLFSFGGLGVWTIIDIILIAVRFLGPADGSLYVD